MPFTCVRATGGSPANSGGAPRSRPRYGSRPGQSSRARGASPQSAGVEKSIVYSQWTGVLDLIEPSLQQHKCVA